MAPAIWSFALIVAAAVAPARTHASPWRGTVVVLGDSITDAEGVAPEQGFVGVLRARHPHAVLLAQGRPGWSTASYLRRLDEVLSRVPPRADTILVQLGSNDLRERGHHDRTITETTANIDDLLDRLHAHAPDARLVLVAPPMVQPQRLNQRLRQAGFGPQTPAWLLRLRDAYRVVATRRRMLLIDLSGVLRGHDTLDGAHPTAAGHARIADAVERALRMKVR